MRGDRSDSHDPEAGGQAPSRSSGRDVRRITQEPDGPMLIEGPVEVRLPDGTLVRSDRPTVALCVCRRSRIYPWCDTSHRRRTKAAGEAVDEDARRGDGAAGSGG